MMGNWWHKGRKWLVGGKDYRSRSARSTVTSRPLEMGALAMAGSSSLAAAGGAHPGSLQATSRLASLPLATSALSLASDTSLAAAGESHEASTESTTLVSLPIEILALIHSSVLQADPSLRSCLALEATCQPLRSLLHRNTRFQEVSVEGGNLASAVQGASFWSWIAVHGSRVDRLMFHNLGLCHLTPRLCSKAGVLQARAVSVHAFMQASAANTLEPLRGLLKWCELRAAVWPASSGIRPHG
jgi:hypothetical protein